MPFAFPIAALSIALLSCVPIAGPDRAPLGALGVAILLFVALTVYQRRSPGSFDDGDTLEEALDRVSAEIAAGLRDPPVKPRFPRR